MSRTFTCSSCGETYNSERPEGEAEAECMALFGETPTAETHSLVCDDCFHKMAKHFGWNVDTLPSTDSEKTE